MPRYISPALQNLLNSGEGIAPIMVIGIVFGIDNYEHLYADRDLGDPLNPVIRGSILELSQLENVKRIDGNGSASQISFKLSDADGYIKSILDANDIIYRKVKVYQYFEGLALSDMVMLFEGVVATPVIWEEGTRTISISAMTRQSTHETGFSLDESGVDIFHQSLLDKPWPMVFGSPIYTPTLPLQEVPIGTLVHGCVLPDTSIPFQIQKIQFALDSIRTEPARIYQEDYINEADPASAWASALLKWELAQRERIDALNVQIADLQSQQMQQYDKWLPQNEIIGGYRFPQGKKIVCKINERTFKIKFNGVGIIPSHPDQACSATLELYEIQPYFFDLSLPLTREQQIEANKYDAEQQAIYLAELEKYGYGTLVTRDHRKYFNLGQASIDKAGADYFPAGTQVEMFDDLDSGYSHVASITPGTVQGVYAYRTQNGYRRLAQVPAKYYTIKTTANAGLIATYVVLNRPLSTISYYNNLKTTGYEKQLLALQEQQGQQGVSRLTNKIEWEDEIFVNFQGSIGPNVIDVMIWLILGYTSYDMDAITFNRVHAQLATNPVHFCLLERQNVDALLQEIAYQCRCALWLKNGTYYIKYLAANPVITDTITDVHIDFGSLRIEASSSDNLITKYVASWKPDGISEESKLVVKNNVERFGIIEESHSFFCFNNYNQVIKAATFWLIRRSTIWKKVFCNLQLNKMSVETLDDVILKLDAPHVTIDPDGIWSQVESSQYDSKSNLIEIELWLSIRFGEMTFYPFSYPAELPAFTVYAPNPPLYSGRPPAIAKERFTPLMPFYNEIQRTIVLYAPPSVIVSVDKKVEPNGNIAGSGRYPSTFGDRFPSDLNLQVPLPNYTVASFTDVAPASDLYKFEPIPVAPTTTVSTTGNSNVYPGRVWGIGDSGASWLIDTWPNGVSQPVVRVLCQEIHGDANLAGLVGEIVTVYEMTENGTQKYYFATQHSAAIPLRFAEPTVADIFPQGTVMEGISGIPVHQIQIADGTTVPPGTWAIGVRVWNENTARYEVQVPVWQS